VGGGKREQLKVESGKWRGRQKNNEKKAMKKNVEDRQNKM
jgi:hypothetical protein